MFFQKLSEKLRKQNILEINLKIFKYYGILLDDSVKRTPWEKAMDIIKQVFTTSLVVQYFLGTAVELYLSMDNVQRAGNCFIFLISHLKNAVKLGTLIIYRKRILLLLAKIENNNYIQGITPTNPERSLVEKYVNLSKRIAKYVWISFFITQVSLAANMPPRPNLELIADPEEIKNIRRDSSIKMWFPFKAIESPYFEVTAVYECITMSIYFAFTTTVNITLVGLIIHMTGQFAVLVDAIQNGATRVAELLSQKRRDTGYGVGAEVVRLLQDQRTGRIYPTRLESSDTEGQSEICGKSERVIGGTEEPIEEKCFFELSAREMFHREMDRYLGCYVAHHQELLQMVELLDSVVSAIMFTQILTSAILFAFIGILMASATDSSIFIMAMTCLTYVMLETGLVCWIATELSTQSEEVGAAAGRCEWFNESIRFRNSILPIIMRAQRPARLSVGPFGTLSLELFGKIMNSAYSYFTLLKEVSGK